MLRKYDGENNEGSFYPSKYNHQEIYYLCDSWLSLDLNLERKMSTGMK